MSGAKEYQIILERTCIGYSAYCPDLPVCAASGVTKEETLRRMRDIIRSHLDKSHPEKSAAEDIPVPESSALRIAPSRP